MNILSELALKYQTDKGPHDHNYTEVYYDLFKDLQHKEITFLEIGIGTRRPGASLRVWRDFFTAAKVISIDVDEDSIEEVREEGLNCTLCSQDDKDALKAFAEEHGPFDVIIDDGSHAAKHQQRSLAVLFHYLKSNGIYVIEDLQCNREKGWMKIPIYSPRKRWLKERAERKATYLKKIDPYRTVNVIRRYLASNKFSTTHMTKKDRVYFTKFAQSVNFHCNDKMVVITKGDEEDG